MAVPGCCSICFMFRKGGTGSKFWSRKGEKSVSLGLLLITLMLRKCPEPRYVLIILICDPFH